MSVRKLPTGKWLSECYPKGRDGKRVRKQFATKGEALSFESYTMEQAKNKPWLGDKEDRRKLLELIDLWYKLHGCSLGDKKGRLAKLEIICKGLGNPIAADITAKDWAHYRDQRLSGKIDNGYSTSLETRKVSTGTVNCEHAFLRAVFNELTRLGEWSLPNPLANIREFDQPEREMAWLSDEQIDSLLAACDLHGNPELTLIVRLCLSTGARWNEAAKMKASQLSPNKITFIHTKGKKNRTVPLSEEMYESLAARKGVPFAPCYKQFYRVIRLAGIELPEGQMTHVLRHTFASHFMMAGGNIIVLQRILGHSDIRVTMRYAHFAPDHLEDAIHFNPLARFLNGGKVAAQDEIAGNTREQEEA
ncbi:tyrosine-type recombinase/integrase [Yersinia ruckeri]|uniref:phage integrase n=1 Tax=Yersinia ruckeri TaxID=29486 RepID=UPI0005E72EA6|nr:tyrosine-type recombinase/integrase [Yersinia ruckeri]EKN3361025.1 tyrosine-type recombinase/integrase [Yersinia ruckeri]EKN4200822.1 tyrosine-type recombinase/integrase [Yersinia ruckeri]EKN4691072.1 tyrosine-type recombinase/integrase [Yersinia ruckeri]EKN4693391.1 tyrosine-type recombinase/integrase [Yersinia ruckeri]EKN4725467.1 tyrosine-type recombinase/integrase [Yersinia ruckeri]